MSYTLSAIRADDSDAQGKLDALLQKEGIRRDRHLDYTCGLFDDGENLIATGSCFGNTLRCFAVSGEHQGEGLLNQILSHLMEVQVARGNTHLFLYTKPASAKFFSDLGFYEITRVEGSVVFMENRRSGFQTYCDRLQRAPEGRTAAVVMNANPFTLGHLHLVKTAASENDYVHLFVLSEEAGPIPFAVRKRLVSQGVSGIKNVILHDSGPYIISSATFPSYFLRDEDTAIRAHAALDLQMFGKIASALNITRRYVGEEPTSHVTALYNDAMTRELPKLGVECRVIPRLCVDGRVVSASTVRQAIHDGDLPSVAAMLPETTLQYFTSPEAAPVVAAIQASSDVVHY